MLRKGRKAQQIWLHTEVVDALRAIRPANVAPTDRVFTTMPRMDHRQRMLAAAGIPYMDELGRQADFHTLRHTFNTNLARHGTPERVRMELMRHKKTPHMTSDVYTDVSLLPTAMTMERLPGFSDLKPKQPSHRASQTPARGRSSSVIGRHGIARALVRPTACPSRGRSRRGIPKHRRAESRNWLPR